MQMKKKHNEMEEVQTFCPVILVIMVVVIFSDIQRITNNPVMMRLLSMV